MKEIIFSEFFEKALAEDKNIKKGSEKYLEVKKLIAGMKRMEKNRLKREMDDIKKIRKMKKKNKRADK